MDAILNWFNEQWFLSALLVFFIPVWAVTLPYLIWDNKRLAKEASKPD